MHPHGRCISYPPHEYPIPSTLSAQALPAQIPLGLPDNHSPLSVLFCHGSAPALPAMPCCTVLRRLSPHRTRRTRSTSAASATEVPRATPPRSFAMNRNQEAALPSIRTYRPAANGSAMELQVTK